MTTPKHPDSPARSPEPYQINQRGNEEVAKGMQSRKAQTCVRIPSESEHFNEERSPTGTQASTGLRVPPSLIRTNGYRGSSKRGHKLGKVGAYHGVNTDADAGDEKLAAAGRVYYRHVSHVDVVTQASMSRCRIGGNPRRAAALHGNNNRVLASDAQPRCHRVSTSCARSWRWPVGISGTHTATHLARRVRWPEMKKQPFPLGAQHARRFWSRYPEQVSQLWETRRLR